MTQPPMFMATDGSVKNASGAWFNFMGIDRDDAPEYRSLVDFGRAPADEAWVYSCVKRRMDAAQSIPLRVYVKQDGEWVDNEHTTDQDAKDLQFLLDDVNPESEGSELQAYTEGGACVWGGSYWKKVRGKYGGRPQELWWLPGPNVTPDPARSLIETYTYRPSGTASDESIRARDIIPFRGVNLQDPRKLVSPLSSARNEIATNRAASEWNASTLRNHAIPAGAWIIEKGEEISTGETGVIRRVLRGLRGPKNAGKSPILPVPLRWQSLAMSPKDADWIASRKVSRMTICAVLGVPLVLAGDDDKNTVYGNLRDAERVMYRGTTIPELDKRASKINSWLTPEFDDPDPRKRHLMAGFDYSGIEALQPAPADAMAQWLEGVKVGLPLNRYIKRFNMGAPVEGGDESRVLLGRAGDVGLTPNDQSADAPPAPAAPASPKPRPAEYQTSSQTGKDPAESVRSVGNLYAHPAVRAFMTGGELDTSFLGDVEPVIGSLLEVALKRRYSVDQIIDGVPAEGYSGFPVRTP